MAIKEEWREIPGYEGRYSASNKGRIRSNRAQVQGVWGDNLILKHSYRGRFKSPYVSVYNSLGGITKPVAVLVLNAFGDPVTNLNEILWIDGDRRNCSLSNLATKRTIKKIQSIAREPQETITPWWRRALNAVAPRLYSPFG